MNLGKYQSKYDALGMIQKAKFYIDPKPFIDKWEREEIVNSTNESSTLRAFESFKND